MFFEIFEINIIIPLIRFCFVLIWFFLIFFFLRKTIHVLLFYERKFMKFLTDDSLSFFSRNISLFHNCRTFKVLNQRLVDLASFPRPFLTWSHSNTLITLIIMVIVLIFFGSFHCRSLLLLNNSTVYLQEAYTCSNFHEDGEWWVSFRNQGFMIKIRPARPVPLICGWA